MTYTVVVTEVSNYIIAEVPDAGIIIKASREEEVEKMIIAAAHKLYSPGKKVVPFPSPKELCTDKAIYYKPGYSKVERIEINIDTS